MAPVQRVVDHDLPSGEELDMGSTGAGIGDLFVLQPVVGWDDVEVSLHRRASLQP